MDNTAFLSTALQNPFNRAILGRLASLGLPDAWLTAGCLFQTVWNVRTGRPPAESISDYDIFYFDGSDLSWEAEDRVIRRITAVVHDLGVRVDIKNQARVHLWYEQRFGAPYPQLHSSREGIGRFLIRCTCVGVRADESMEVYAPDGFEDLCDGVLRPNPLTANPVRFLDKAGSYRARWPWLRIGE
jgi:hypothetical protein